MIWEELFLSQAAPVPVRAATRKHASPLTPPHGPFWQLRKRVTRRWPSASVFIRRAGRKSGNTVEAPLALVDALQETASISGAQLVDCLTLWLSNLMQAERDVRAEIDRLCNYLTDTTTPVVLVTNEVGMGIVPANALARRFRGRSRTHESGNSGRRARGGFDGVRVPDDG